MKDYKEESELIRKSKNGDMRSLKKLIADYEPLMKDIAGKTTMKWQDTPLEYEDVSNILLHKFCKIVEDYDETRETHFATYAKTYLEYHANNKMKHYATNKHKTMNYATMTPAINDDNTDKITYSVDRDYKNSSSNFKQDQIRSELNDVIYEASRAKFLTQLEKEIFISKLENGTFEAYLNESDKSITTVRNLYQRALKKMQNYYK